MAENTEQLKKKDLELFLEVNKKAIEIETEVADQNEEIISLLNDVKSSQEIIKSKQENIETLQEKLVKKTDEIDRDLFKIQVLFITGVLSLLIQIVQIFIKK